MTDFLPTASLSHLQQRAILMRETRRYFDDAGYFEVDTPLLSADVVVDAWIEPIVATFRSDPFSWASGAGEPRYLQTSPEFAMKRLLAGGADAIYQLGKVFRNGEVGQRHNPEFTMLEWYRCGDDLDDQLAWTESLLTHLWTRIENDSNWPEVQRQLARRWLATRAFERLTYEAAFERFLNLPALTCPMTALHEAARSRQLVPPPTLDPEDRDGWLNWLLAEVVEPQLGRDRPVFLYDYPATQAALAVTQTRPDGVSVARRFELYVDGIEYCNGYHELTNADELRRRNDEQSRVRAAAGLMPLPCDSRLLAAMDAGLPESAGVALGFDRLVMLLLGCRNIAEVIPFDFARA